MINPWEVQDIKIQIDNQEDFLDRFIIYDVSNLNHQTTSIAKTNIENIKKEINKWGNSTQIMVCEINISTDMQLFILIFDNIILICEKSSLQQFEDYIRSKDHLFLFLTEKIEKEFHYYLSQTLKKIEPNSSTVNCDFELIDNKIQRQIIYCIIKKSQYRTILNRRCTINDQNALTKDFKIKDFVPICFLGSQSSFKSVKLCYNVKDQLIYILKVRVTADTQSYKSYQHEIEFYSSINNKFHYISKMYGQFECNNNKYIILEYVEGESLCEFIQNNKNHPNLLLKINIILKILLSVEYIHSKGFFLRDLKWDNIIIDSSLNAILIDFDSAKRIASKYDENSNEQTGDIGNLFFAAPEQSVSNDYSFKVDVYSIGVIIHLILEENFSKCSIDLEDLEDFEQIYKKCMETSPQERPNVSEVINEIFEKVSIWNNNIEMHPILKSNFDVRLEFFQSILDSSSKNFIGEIEIYYFFGNYYYHGIYISKDFNKSIQYLTYSANHGHSEAQYMLGHIFYDGIVLSKNINKAIYFLSKSSEQKNKNASFLLGQIYYDNVNIPRDINKAIYYYEIAANQKYSIALQTLGMIYYFGENGIKPDANKSIHYLQLALEQNDLVAPFLLGEIYYQAKLIPRDINKAIKYYTIASDKYIPVANLRLGEIYYKGISITRDINKALYYLKLASQQGDPESQYLLGYIYYEGIYIQKNINKAIKYLEKASDQDIINATNLLVMIYNNSNIIPNDINKLICHLIYASNAGNSFSQYLLGLLYYQGKHVSKNVNKSIEYLTLSSNNGNPMAQLALGAIYFFGEYVPCDIPKSLNYFLLSSKQNIPMANYYLGIIYYKGKNVQQDISKSIYYYQLASDNNISYAQFNLGIIYYEGKYVKKDVEKSIYYLQLAANQYFSEAQFYLGLIYLFETEFLNIDKALNYLTLSSYQSNSKANYALGIINLSNLYVPSNINKSIYFFSHVSKEFYPDAQFYLGYIYYFGNGVTSNINKAIRFFKESSSFNDHRAKNNLGIIYKNGNGVDKSIYRAIEYFTEGINQKNDPFSMCNLARIYYFGDCIERNPFKAIELLERASLKMRLADIFLFVIFTFGEEDLRNNEKSDYYGSQFKCINYISNLIKDSKNTEKLIYFFKEYDILYSDYDPFDDFIFFMKNGIFFNANDCCISSHIKQNQVPINEKFYDGFNNGFC